MKYVEHINSVLSHQISKTDNLVVFGQNINAGSCLGGLSKGLTVKKTGKIINTQNSENTLVGVGFGLMLNNVSSIFFMKQQDFLLLSMDHLVNTYNVLRVNQLKASFTIVPVIVDSGYEGPMSALNNFSDFCSIANIEGYAVTNKNDSLTIIQRHLVTPGFRIIGVSQRLMKQEVLELDVISNDEKGNYFQYAEGDCATIICFNFSLPYGFSLCKNIEKQGKSASLFSVNTFSEFDFSKIIKDISKTRKLIVIDDSKSRNQLSDRFIFRVQENCILKNLIVIRRTIDEKYFYPNPDELRINYQEILEQVI